MVSLGAGFDMLRNVSLLVSGVTLDMRSLFTASVRQDCCIKHILRAGHCLFGIFGIKFCAGILRLFWIMWFA